MNVARTKEEKEQVFKFRYQIYKTELNRLSTDSVTHNDMMYDDYDFMDETIILYSGSLKNITGTIRLVLWDKDVIPKNIRTKYQIDKKIIANVERIGELGYFHIKQEYRKSLLALALTSFFYELISKSPSLLPDIIYCCCLPGLLPLYLKLGCYTYTQKMNFDEDGIAILLCLRPYDFKHLNKVKSPIYYQAKYYFKQYQKQVTNPTAGMKLKNFKYVLPHLSLYATRSQLIKYKKNIKSEKFKKYYDFLVTLMKKNIAIPLVKNQIIIKKNTKDYDIFLLVEGELGIIMNNALIAKLAPGAILGEIALFDEEHMRSTDVLALTNAKIMLLSRSLLSRLVRNDPSAAIKLLHILCNNLSDKLSSSNKLLSNFYKNKDI